MEGTMSAIPTPNSVRSAARNARRAIIQRDAINRIGPMLAIAFGVASLMILVDRLWLDAIGQWWVVPVALGFIAIMWGWAEAARRAPDTVHSAGILDDRLALDSRLRAALELHADHENAGFVELAMRDADALAASIDPSEALPDQRSTPYRYACVAALACVAIGIWVPSRSMTSPEPAPTPPVRAITEIESAEEVTREIKQDEETPEAVLERLDELEALKDELAQGVKDEQEADARTAAKLEELADAMDDAASDSRDESEAMSESIESLQNQKLAEQDSWDPRVEEFAQSMRDQEYDQALDQIDAINEAMESMTPEQRDQIAEQLEEIANAIDPEDLDQSAPEQLEPDLDTREGLNEPSEQAPDEPNPSDAQQEEHGGSSDVDQQETEPQPKQSESSEQDSQPEQNQGEQASPDESEQQGQGEQQNQQQGDEQGEQQDQGTDSNQQEQSADESQEQRTEDQGESQDQQSTESTSSDQGNEQEQGEQSEPQSDQDQQPPTQEQDDSATEAGEEQQQREAQQEQDSTQGEQREVETPSEQQGQEQQQGEPQQREMPRPGEALEERLREMERQQRQSQQQREQAEQLREQAERLMNRDPSQEDEGQGTRRAPDQIVPPEMSEGGGDGERDPNAPDLDPTDTDSDFIPVDARDEEAPGDGKPIGEWYGPDGEPVAPGTNEQTAQRFRRASQEAQRAVEEQQIPRRYRHLVREVFQRVQERADKMDGTGTIAPQGQDAVPSRPKPEGSDNGG